MTTDAYWRVPHFEKMLYDQAMGTPAEMVMAPPAAMARSVLSVMSSASFFRVLAQ